MKKIIGFTTIHSRIDKIKPMVDSIFNQSLKADEIILWIANLYRRINNNVEIKIPDFLKQSEVFSKILAHDLLEL